MNKCTEHKNNLKKNIELLKKNMSYGRTQCKHAPVCEAKKCMVDRMCRYNKKLNELIKEIYTDLVYYIYYQTDILLQHPLEPDIKEEILQVSRKVIRETLNIAHKEFDTNKIFQLTEELLYEKCDILRNHNIYYLIPLNDKDFSN